MLNDNDERVTFGLPDIGIPAEALFHPDLTTTEKVLFGFLRNLSQSSKGCWATNKYLGKFLGLKKQTISKAVSKLEKLEFIVLVFDEGQSGQTIRRIFINPELNKIYRDLVKSVHDAIENEGDMIKIIGGYDKSLSKYVNEDVSDDSYESLGVFSPKKRKRKRKSNKPSMKDRTKQKAQQKAPKKKQQNKVTYENIPNTQLLQIWNQQSNLRTHQNKVSNTYKQNLRKLEALRKGTLYKSVSEDMLQSDVPYEWFSTPWKKSDISKAIKTLNEWCKEGNYPAKKDWIKRLSLSDAIFNTRSGSPLMQAYKYGVRTLFDPHSMLVDSEEQIAYNYFAKFFAEVQKKQDVKTQKQIVDLVLDLKDRREENASNWARYDPEYFDYGVPPASLQYLALDYVEFLRGKYPTEFEPNKSLTPRGLKIGSYVWERFSKAYWHKFGVDVISGPK